MFANLSDRATAVTFIVLVLALSAGTATIAGGLVLVLSPLLVTLVMMLAVTREGWSRAAWGRLGLGRPGLRTWPLALLTTVGVCVLAVAAVVVLGYARFTTPHGAWAADLLGLCLTGPVLAFVEEIGWRGYLQPRLAFLGANAAMLVVGLVWAAWHMPYILFTPDYHAGGARWLVLSLFTGSVIAFSFLFGRLRARSGSVWPAVLAHFAHNATFAMLSTHLITTDHRVLADEYLAGDTGLFVLLGTAVCAALIGFSRATERRSPPAPGHVTPVFAGPTPGAS